MRFLFCIVLCLFIISTAHGNEHPCALGIAKTGRVDQINQRESWFALEGTPQKFTLDGLATVTPGDEYFSIGSEVRLYADKKGADRYGRLAVQVWAKNQWVQGSLLEGGRAFSFALKVPKTCRQAMLSKEGLAERAKRGVWSQPDRFYRAENVESLSKRAGHLVLVTGQVLSVGDRKRRLYLNFGQNWSQDFTVSVSKKGSGAFNGDVKALLDLKNKNIRVRGMLEEQQGPLIRVIDEAQIEILD